MQTILALVREGGTSNAISCGFPIGPSSSSNNKNET